PRSRMALAALTRSRGSLPLPLHTSTSVARASAVCARASCVIVSPFGPTRGERPPGLPDWPFLKVVLLFAMSAAQRPHGAVAQAEQPREARLLERPTLDAGQDCDQDLLHLMTPCCFSACRQRAVSNRCANTPSATA